jgi:hypothetical protein
MIETATHPHANDITIIMQAPVRRPPLVAGVHDVRW